MKKLFKNYSYNFDKNEAKIIASFCKQAINQMGTDKSFYGDVKAFNTISEKVAQNPSDVKLTKDEKVRLVRQLNENVKHIKKTMDNSWIIKKWFYRTMYNQYHNLLTKHFND
ncbi:MAG: hypothetical protein ABFS12_14050 [Bacteroidota bacterium]